MKESARLTGASLGRRTIAITVPLAVRGLAAGGILIFVKIIRDLNLVVLPFTLTMPVRSLVAYRDASEFFTQFANALTVVIASSSARPTLFCPRWGTNWPPHWPRRFQRSTPVGSSPLIWSGHVKRQRG